MASILVTGGAGYVGSHTVKALTEAGHTCLTFDNLSLGHRDFVRWGPLIVGDIRDPTALDAVFKNHAVDAVMHFAALAYVGESMQAPGRYYDVNVGGTRTLLDAMVRARVAHIVFSSSCAVYGADGADPITEQHATNPVNPYGFTKLVCERMMDDYGLAHGVQSVRLRYFNAAGADPSGEIGEHHEPETHLIPLVLDAATGRRKNIGVYGTNYATRDGTAIRDFIHVTDLAAAHVAAVKFVLGGPGAVAFNLGAGAGVSVRELIRAAEFVTQRRIAAIDAGRRAGDPPMLVANADLARQTLNWKPLRSDLETILHDAWSWQLKRFGDASTRT